MSATTESSFNVAIIKIIHVTFLTLNVYGIFTHSISLLQLFFDDSLHGYREGEKFKPVGVMFHMWNQTC